jgi:hypothetical protein
MRFVSAAVLSAAWLCSVLYWTVNLKSVGRILVVLIGFAALGVAGIVFPFADLHWRTRCRYLRLVMARVQESLMTQWSA